MRKILDNDYSIIFNKQDLSYSNLKIDITITIYLKD